MPFEVSKLPLSGLLLIQPGRFEDQRGYFRETYKQSDFLALGLPLPFVQDNHSFSRQGVLRGLHYQAPGAAQGKLVWVLEGRVWDTAVDLRRSSPTFGGHWGVELSGESGTMFYLPPGFAHGFVVLSREAHFLYKCTAEYSPREERGIRWDDPDLAIPWPLEQPRISSKDAGLPFLKDAAGGDLF